jgi:endonuclease/exonuclease/phosphatase family metal-dependent hydrolase
MMRNTTLFLVAFLLVVNIHAQEIRVATYNMRYDNPHDTLNAWTQRLPVIGQLIHFYDFDIFGAQELLSHQIDGLQQQLPEYAWIGVGRDDGLRQGEYSPIFYKKADFTLLRQGTFWLAEHTDVPGKGWDAALPRICTWGEFEAKKGKQRFFVFNTHFDHKGEKARLESARLILNKMKQLAGSGAVILLGDFNFDQDHEGYRILASGSWKDSFSFPAVKLANTSTFNNFDIKTAGDRRIDHIFVAPQFNVKKYGILTDSYQGKLPSDHFPVMIVAEWKK